MIRVVVPRVVCLSEKETVTSVTQSPAFQEWLEEDQRLRAEIIERGLRWRAEHPPTHRATR